MGGVLYIKDVSVEILASVFRFNSAGSAGGALDISVQSIHTKVIYNSWFEGNRAAEGGAIKWRDNKLVYSNVTFHNNQAAYGPDLASYGITVSSLSQFATEGEVSGQKVILTFEVLDHANKRVTTTSNTILRLLPSPLATYVGNPVSLSSEGLFQFSGLSIQTSPASQITFYLATEGATRVLNGSVTVQFRNCTTGEIYHSNMCEYCNVGNVSYSPDDPYCSLCPNGATCHGGNNLTVKAGYWRSASNVTKVLACSIAEKCLGGPNSTCANGFQGKLCTECAEQHYRVRVFECVACRVELWVAVVIVPLILVLFMWAVVHFSIRRPDEFRLHLLKTLINHIQLLSIIAPFKVVYPPVFFYSLQGLAHISSLLLADLPIACLGYSNSELIKAVIGSLIVPILTGCSLLFAVLYRQQYRRVVCALVTSFLLFTPVISLQTVVPLLICQRVNGQEKWLVTDMSVQCWEGLHLLVTSSVLVPAVLLSLLPMCLALVVRPCFPRAFEVYFPLWSAGQLWKLWDVVQMLCKCTCLWIVLNSISEAPLGQITYAIIGLIGMSVVTVVFQPVAFNQNFYFVLSEFSILIVAISVVASSFYIYSSPDGGVRDVLLSILVCALNGGFFVVCLKLLVFGKAKEKAKAVRSEVQLEQEVMRVPNNSFMLPVSN